MKSGLRILFSFVPAALAAIVMLSACGTGTTISIAWVPGTLDDAKAAAAREGRDVFVYFYSESCMYCEYMKGNVLNQNDVIRRINGHYVPVMIDGNSDAGKAIRTAYTIKWPPTALFTKADGIEIDRIAGQAELPDFIKRLDEIRKNIYTADYYRTLIAKQPGKTGLLEKLFGKYAERGDVGGMTTVLTDIKNSDPEFYALHAEKMYNTICRASFDNGDYPQARAIAQRVIDEILTEKVRTQYLFIANCYRNENDYPRAFDTYRTMIETFPGDSFGYSNMMSFSYATGHGVEESIVMGTRALARLWSDTDRAVILYSIGKMYEKKGDLKRALDIAIKALALNQDTPYYKFKEELETRMRGGKAGEPGTGIVLSMTEWNIGETRSSFTTTATLDIANKSGTSVNIDFGSSCECLRASPGKTRIGSNGSVSVSLVYDAKGDSGPVERAFVISTDRTGQERIVLPVRANVHSK